MASEMGGSLEAVWRESAALKQVRAATRTSQMSGKGKLYFEFWERYFARLREVRPEWSRGKAVPYSSVSSVSASVSVWSVWWLRSSPATKALRAAEGGPKRLEASMVAISVGGTMG